MPMFQLVLLYSSNIKGHNKQNPQPCQAPINKKSQNKQQDKAYTATNIYKQFFNNYTQHTEAPYKPITAR